MGLSDQLWGQIESLTSLGLCFQIHKAGIGQLIVLKEGSIFQVGISGASAET